MPQRDPLQREPAQSARPLVAVDIGNTRLKLGLFRTAALAPGPASALPEPSSAFDALPHEFDRPDGNLDRWLSPLAVRDAVWWIGSVQRSFTTELLDFLRERNAASNVTLITSADLPLKVDVPYPDRVGIDRLLGAVAANHIRPPHKAAVVVDVGTAITVDQVSAEGAFQGGAILPGIAMSARAFHDATDLLPLVEMSELATPPAALGTDTVAAMKSGLFWGAVGGVRELIARLPVEDPFVLLTGGAAPLVAPLLHEKARYEPHLVLAGIALSARQA